MTQGRGVGLLRGSEWERPVPGLRSQYMNDTRQRGRPAPGFRMGKGLFRDSEWERPVPGFRMGKDVLLDLKRSSGSIIIL